MGVPHSEGRETSDNSITTSSRPVGILQYAQKEFAQHQLQQAQWYSCSGCLCSVAGLHSLVAMSVHVMNAG